MLSVAVVVSVAAVTFFGGFGVVVGAATVGATASGLVTVTVTKRLSTAAPPFAGVTVSTKASAALEPTLTVGAVNFAVGVSALVSSTEAPDTCAQRYDTAPVGTLAATLWLPSSVTTAPLLTVW